MLRPVLLVFLLLLPAACGSIYRSPAVSDRAGDAGPVRVVPITAESLLDANRSPYTPRRLPDVFFANAGAGGTPRGTGALPEPASGEAPRSDMSETGLPPAESPAPYRIGVGDILRLSVPQAGAAAQPSAPDRAGQEYSVQDDGAVALPDIGRVPVAGLTLEEAEDKLFRTFLENQVPPSFSLGIAEFNARRVAVGGAVARPTVLPVTLTPLYLGEALARAGGVAVAEPARATVRIYRDGTLYRVPVVQVHGQGGAARLLLKDGDSIFVDAGLQPDRARARFEEELRLAEFRQSARRNALGELETEISLRRAALEEDRANFHARLELGAVERDRVYIAGEAGRQGVHTLPFGRRASLAEALFDEAQGISFRTGDPTAIYVLRAGTAANGEAAVTAWNLDASNAANLTLAARFELRPDDVIFVAEQPVTRWNRVVQQLTPSLFSSAAQVAGN